ncbi:MAG: hypothetical protein AB9834_15815 [Lentimicrobium sp.]
MTFLEMFFIFLNYCVFILVLTFAASHKKIGKLRIFLISLFFTPLVGFFAYRFSEPASLLHYTRYRCPRCGVDFTEPMIDCPYCRRDGEITKLHPMLMKSI